MNRIFCGLLLLLATTAFGQVTSTFDSDADGWTFFDASTPITVTYQPVNGNPGGFVSASYNASASATVESWFAPSKFRGNLVTRSLGQNLRFDLQQSAAGTTSGPSGDVRIESGSNVLVYTLPTKPATAPAWSSYAIKLDDTGGWRWSSPGGSAATLSQVIQVLTNVTSIEIRGTYATSTTFTSGLDNVILEQIPPPTPHEISGISPSSGPPGTSVTISGSNFDPTAANYRVYFGNAQGAIVNASATQVTVTVPDRATFGPITLINIVSGSVVASPQPFTPTFSGGGRIIAGSFKPKVDVPLTGTELSGLATMDLDGDGWLDVVAAQGSGNTLAVYRNLGAGGVLSVASFDTPLTLSGGGNQSGLFIRDLDGDGKQDLAAGYSNGSLMSFVTFRNTSTPGSLSFETAELWPGLVYSGSLANVVDVDGDGRIDLIGQHGNGSVAPDLWIAQNISTPGNIQYAASQSYFGGGTVDAGSGVGVGDLNNDGKPELLVKYGFGNQFAIVKNNSIPGNIQLETPVAFSDAIGGTIQVHDVNQDGKNDLIWKRGSSNDDVRVRINTHAGGTFLTSDFATEFIFNSEMSNYGSVWIDELNGDGRPDIVATDSRYFGVFESNFSGGPFTATSFTPAFIFEASGTSTYPDHLASGDLNGDGRPDIVVGVTNTNPVRLLLYESRLAAAPRISLNTVSPLSAPVGGTILITGSGFSASPVNNHVYIAGMKATVLSSSTNHITALVPPGTGFGKVTVRVGELSSTYHLPFMPAFSSGVTFNGTQFGPPVAIALAGANYDIEAGDLDLDGKPDVIAEGSGLITRIFHNTHASGPITAASLTSVASTSNSAANPKLMDIDGDGRLDISGINGRAFPNQSSPGTIAFGTDFSSGSNGNLEHGDFNQDGKPDMAVVNGGGSQLLLMENRSTPGLFVDQGTFGTFGPDVVFSKPSVGGSIAVADLDIDGYDDVVVSNNTLDNVSFYRNAQALKITTAQLAARIDLAVGDNPGRIYPGDLDRDGKTDLVIYYGVTTTSNFVTVLHNQSTPGNLAFNRVDYPLGGFATVAHISDLDGDGRPEILVVGEAANRLSIFKNLSSPGVLDATSFAAPFHTSVTGPRGLSTADINRDGKPEILVTVAAGNLLIYENLITSTLPPGISTFSPSSGPVGTTVTITGSNFSPTPANNLIYFGATQASVTAATTTQLTVVVPVGATYDPITVTVSGLIAYSQVPFLVTFPGGGVIDACALGAPTFLGTDNFGYGLATGDIDGDGKTDIVVANNGLDAIQVFRNTASPGALDASSLALPFNLATGTDPSQVRLSDIDGDGKLDIIATSYASNIVSIFRNIASPGSLTAGSFAPRMDYATGSGPDRLACFDLDKDGRTDMVVANNPGNSLSIFRNIGVPGLIDATTFAPRFEISAPASALEVADIDVDGKPDIVVGHSIGNQLGIIRNISTPGSLSAASFASRVDFPSSDWHYYTAVGDLDADGRPEIITVSTIAWTFSIHKNLSTPGIIDATSFAPRVNFSTDSSPQGVAITDIDGDGKPDIAVMEQISGRVALFKNTGSPGIINATSFAPRLALPAGSNPRSLKLSDLDGDGKPDLIASNWSGPSLSVVRNTVSGQPTVTSFTPASGPRGTLVTITGTNFSTVIADMTVEFNGVVAPVVSSTPTTLSVVVPGNATTGALRVTRNCKSPVMTPDAFTVIPFSVDPCRTSINLNGAGDYVRVTNNPSLEPSTLTLEALINFSSAPSFDVIIAKRDGSTFGNSYAIWWESGQLRAGVRLGGSIGTPWSPVIGQWYHVALTYNSVTQVERLYLDGVQVASGTVIAPFYAPDDLLIGADVNFGSVDGFFHGKIDEVRVWNTNRSAADILINMNSSLTGTEPGLVAYYRMNHTGAGPGITISNGAQSTGTTNNGVTFGTATTPTFDSPCSCVPAIQRNALIALYNATDGANWADNTGWLSPDESTWFGITVTGCDITDISLPGNNLVGSLPPEIGDLPLLEGLDLGANQLSGSIPPEVGNLSALIGLNLALNQMDGFLPPELGNLTSLEVLNLSYNLFNGTPPIELENFTALTLAALNNNQFSGQPPLIGGNSMSMSSLELQFNAFNSLPDLNGYFSINYINVANNRLTFDDLEPFMGLPNFFYDPQAPVPPGGIISFIPGGTLNIPFATGGSGLSYQWYKDNVLIAGETSASLSIPGVTAADVGFYQVRITSSVVPFLVLESMVYTVITDPCAATTPTSGDVDPTFAPSIDVPSYFSQVELQSTGNIIAETGSTVINAVNHNGLLRFLPDGTLDNTFAPNVNTSPFLVQPDDQILASYYGGAYAYVVRMDADGNEDASFTANVPQYYSGYISALARQSDNKILVAGAAYLVDPFIERLNPDGTSDGVLSDANGLDVTVIRVQSDGYILVGGQFPGGIIRLDPTGILDPSFSAQTSDFVSDIAIQSDGKILVAGMFEFVNDIPKRGVVRLHPDGSIDNTFAALGVTNLIESGLNVRRIAIQTDGKIVLAGEFSSINGADRINLVRLNSDGTVDCLFDPGTGTDLAITGLALPSDTQILVSGTFENYNGTQRLGLARVNAGSGSPVITITLQPADASVCENTTTTFTTSAIGTTNITYQWQRLNDQAGSLQGLRWSCAAISSAGADVDNVVDPPDVSATMGGLPGTTYAVTLRFRGVAEAKTYVGGTTTGFWNVGGTPAADGFNVYQLDISDPPATYYLNAGTSGITHTYLLDYMQTVSIKAGATVVLKTFSGDNLQIKNRDNLGSPIVVPGIPPAPAAFDGQFIQMDVEAIDGVLFADISDGGGYSGTTTSMLSVNATGTFGAGRYRCRINGDLATEVITESVDLIVNVNPSPPGATGGSACSSGAIVLTATGASAGQYRWYTTPTGGTALAGEVSDTYTTPVITATTSYYVSIHNGTCESASRTLVTATINTPPSPPVTTGASSCVPGTLNLSALGGSPGEYRWYAAATGGTDLGSGNDTFTTPVITVTTTYHVALNNGTCESTRTPVTATIDVVAKPAITTSNCTAMGATLTGPAGFTSYAWSNGATTQAVAVTAAGSYTLIVTSAAGCSSPPSDPVTFTAAFCNQPPTIQPTPVTTTVQGTITVNVSSMAIDLDNNIDLSSLQVIVQPTSGAAAFINASFELVVDYSGVTFAGTDQLTIELCDVAGACVQEVITIEVAGDITVYNALSPNGDGKNDVFYIQYINALPQTQQNKVTILNRWGVVVFEATNYDNTSVVFRGLTSGGNELPSGTYYYVLEFTSGEPKQTGFISLRR